MVAAETTDLFKCSSHRLLKQHSNTLILIFDKFQIVVARVMKERKLLSYFEADKEFQVVVVCEKKLYKIKCIYRYILSKLPSSCA